MSRSYPNQRSEVWQKNTLPTTAQALGLWYCLAAGAGLSPANSKFGTGTNLAFQALTDVLAGSGGLNHGGDAGGRDGYKRLLKATAISSAPTTAPCTLMLVDMLGFYNVTTTTATTEQVLDNTVALPRHADGEGVHAFITPSTVMGAATPDITLKYTSAQGVVDRTTPSTLPAGLTAAPVGSIPYSGTGAGKYGPFVPEVSGDRGVRRLQSITLSASYVSGVLNLVLAKPLLTLNITAQSTEAVKEFNQMAEVEPPKIYDGACLAWLMLAGAATPVNSAFSGTFDFGWR
jgi:hypothetical protein